MKRTIPYGKQYIDTADINEVVKVLRSDFVTQGPAIPAFEEKLAKQCGARYAVVFNSGTAALHAAYFAAGLTSGDEFITSPITFAATANAGLYCGAKPIFADVEQDTGNIDAADILKKTSKKTKMIVPVHYAGHPAEMKKIHAVAKKNRLFIIEDACHALGALYEGEPVGNCRYSDMAVFSFHPVKHITTGEGGAVTTNNSDHYRKLQVFRTHGITRDGLVNKTPGDWYYEMQFLGYNYRMTDIQAALGQSQLKKLKGFVARRREIVRKYAGAFKNNPYFDLPVERPYAASSYHLYPIRLKIRYVPKRADIFARLRQAGIGVQVHYIPVYLHPYYQKLGYKKGSCHLAEMFYQREISLPMYPAMTGADISRVVKTILAIMRECR